eukprot:TRINITY_DN2062_c0_g2_i5.p1 TRINITY_DN2062_c0_g2~~TRINITY_DN2062_c0_g2_i5.p1  ORF type:complete len:489 (+),score=132.32 TRINITY_DN2062_c0_g2_i5:95-1561(+)
MSVFCGRGGVCCETTTLMSVGHEMFGMQSGSFPFVFYGGWLLVLAVTSYAIRQFIPNSPKSPDLPDHNKEKQDAEDQENAPLKAKKDGDVEDGDSRSSNAAAFTSFQRNYLTVYLIMMGADWFQGPYMYDLYESYGFSMNQIGTLFIMGFGSSMVSGPLVGVIADKFGRKFICLLFAVLYSAACVIVHFNNYWILFIGRLLSGIATSILFSGFESWMVKQHAVLGFPPEKLKSTFAIATTGNGIVAIAAGVIASLVAEKFGPTAPFKCSFILLVVGAFFILLSWTENYGDQYARLGAGLKDAFVAMRQDVRIVTVGLMQSFFESGMYIFVFMWTPALKNTTPFNVLLGWVFAAFMVCVTIGSSLFEFLNAKGWKIENIAGLTFIIGAVSLVLPAVTLNYVVRLVTFFAFELSCGMYFPSIGVLRSRIVPEGQRSTIMTIFRIPLNLIVATVLQNLDLLSEQQIFFICAGCMVVGWFFRTYLSSIGKRG